MQRTRLTLVVVLALASLGGPSFSCGGSEFTDNGSSTGGSGGGADAAADGHAGGSGARDEGGRPDAPAKDVEADTSTSDAPTVMGTCTLGGNECPSGYECGCGGPGPGICECHKKCQSAADCSAPNAMCGCAANDPVKICVSTCFCLCN
jgi:hypothetical protein